MINNNKLQIPPVHKQYVSRPRLDNLLSEILSCPLAIISAPPGSGKTTLLSHWIRNLNTQESVNQNVRTCWITLDQLDNDLLQFWNVLFLSFDVSGDKVNLNQLFDSPTSLYSVINLWVNSIAENQTEYVLVLDDYHQIQDSSIHNSILYLLDHVPDNLHLVFCTRIDPPFPLGRWRIQGKLVEIRSRDLSFIETEIFYFFENQTGIALNQSQILKITNRTEGWVAGLQVFALTLKGLDVGEYDNKIEGFSGRHRFFSEYLSDEVLSHLSNDIFGFLLITSILNKLTGPLCSALLEGTEFEQLDAQKTLLYLFHNNLFISSLDEELVWFRFHPLFQELLQSRLIIEKTEVEINQFYRKASKWYYSQGAISEAVTLSLKAHDPQLTADMINSTLEKVDIWSAGEIHTLLNWINRLPPEIVLQRPWLRLYQSRVLFVAGKIIQSEDILDQLEVDYAGKDIQLLSQIAGSRARIAALQGKVNQAIESGQLALDSLLPKYTLARSSALSSIGYAHLLAGRLEESLKWMNSALHEANTNGFLLLGVNIIANMGWVYYLQGNQEKLEQIIKQGFDQSKIGKQFIPISGLLFLLQAQSQYDQGAIKDAFDSLNKGLDFLKQGGIEDTSQKANILMSNILLSLQDTKNAWLWIEKAADLAAKSGVERSQRFVEAAKANYWLRINAFDKAQKWSAHYQSLDPVEYLHETEDLILARMLLAGGEINKCIDLCKNIEMQASSAGLQKLVMETNIVLSIAFCELKQIDLSQAALIKSLTLAESMLSKQEFINEIILLLPILREANKRGIKLPLLVELLNLSTSQKSSPSTLIQPLSEREIEVVQLIAEGLTNQDIANRLVVAETTVKKHISHIFYKLNVSNRTQVIITARNLNIL